jgi:hypothetical protein
MRMLVGFAWFGRMLILMTADFSGSVGETEGTPAKCSGQECSLYTRLVFWDWVLVFLVEELLAGMVGMGMWNRSLGGGGEDRGLVSGC